MWVKRHVRYVVEKPNKDGTTRLYWQRPGFSMRRLRPPDLREGGLADQLNAAADKHHDDLPPEYGTIAWAVEQYRQSPRFLRLAATTRRIYERWLIAIRSEIGTWPLTELVPKEVYEIIDGIDGPQSKAHCAAVLSKIAKVGMKHGLLSHNPASALELERPPPRDQIWPQCAQRAFLSGCGGIENGTGFRRGFLLLKYTVQRPGDMLRMAWPHYDGTVIRVRQQKTGKLLDVPCHRDLRAELDAAERISTIIVTRDDGRPFTYAQWIKGVREIMALAGIEGLQMRDLRRTGAVELGTLGVSAEDIAAAAGWSIERSTRILETYLPRNVTMAKRAIERWEKG